MIGVTLVLCAIVSMLAITVPWLLVLAIPFLLLFLLPTMAIIGPFVLLRFSSTSQPVKEPKNRELSVLIVDDDPVSILPLISVLSDKNVAIDFVESGDRMLDALKKGSFDLVFLDQVMPGIRGSEALSYGEEQIRPGKKIPIVFFSNIASELKHQTYNQFEIRAIWDKHVPYEVLSHNVESIFREVSAA